MKISAILAGVGAAAVSVSADGHTSPTGNELIALSKGVCGIVPAATAPDLAQYLAALNSAQDVPCTGYGELSAGIVEKLNATCLPVIEGALSVLDTEDNTTSIDVSAVLSQQILVKVVLQLDKPESPLRDVLKSDLLQIILQDFSCVIPDQIMLIVQGIIQAAKAGGSIAATLTSSGVLEGGLDSINTTASCTEGPSQVLGGIASLSSDTSLPVSSGNLAAVLNMLSDESQAQSVPAAIQSFQAKAVEYESLLQQNMTANATIVENELRGIAGALAPACACLIAENAPTAEYGIDSVIVRYASRDDFIPTWNKLFDVVSEVTGVLAVQASTKPIVCGEQATGLGTVLQTGLNACGATIKPFLQQLSNILLKDPANNCDANLCEGNFIPLIQSDDFKNTEDAALTAKNYENLDALVSKLDERLVGELGGVFTALNSQCNPTDPPTAPPTEDESSASTSMPTLAAVVATLTAVGLLRQL